MDTRPKNQQALLPNQPAAAAPTPRAGDRLWMLQKGTAWMAAELRDDTGVDAGVELQLLRDGAFMYGRRHLSRDLALEEADSYRRELEADGWAPAA